MHYQHPQAKQLLQQSPQPSLLETITTLTQRWKISSHLKPGHWGLELIRRYTSSLLGLRWILAFWPVVKSLPGSPVLRENWETWLSSLSDLIGEGGWCRLLPKQIWEWLGVLGIRPSLSLENLVDRLGQIWPLPIQGSHCWTYTDIVQFSQKAHTLPIDNAVALDRLFPILFVRHLGPLSGLFILTKLLGM